MDKIELEQLGYAAPPDIRTWLLRVRPTTLNQAAMCLKNYVLAERSNKQSDQALTERLNNHQTHHPWARRSANVASNTPIRHRCHENIRRALFIVSTVGLHYAGSVLLLQMNGAVVSRMSSDGGRHEMEGTNPRSCQILQAAPYATG